MREQYKIIKSFENNIGVNHYDLELVNGLLDILKIQVKTIKITFIKASCFAYQETKKLVLTDKVFASYVSDEDLEFRVNAELLLLDDKMANKPIF